jgi:ABC-type multidrug transport system ATPase subunit
MKIITVNNLTKNFRKTEAIRNLNFEVNEGEIFGIFGSDGCGKTTLLRILASLLFPDKGKVSVCNFDMEKNFMDIRRKIGYVPETFSLYSDLSVENTIDFFSSIFSDIKKEENHYLKKIYAQIEPLKKQKIKNLTNEMSQKLALYCALIHSPKILILDEPTKQFNSVVGKEFWDLLHEARQYGVSILISTMLAEDVMYCDRIAIMQDGKFITIDSPQNILKNNTGKMLSVRSNKMNELLEDLALNPNIKFAFSFGETYHVNFTENLVEYLIESGHQNIVIEEINPSIEDCLLLIMQKKYEKKHGE